MLRHLVRNDDKHISIPRAHNGAKERNFNPVNERGNFFTNRIGVNIDNLDQLDIPDDSFKSFTPYMDDVPGRVSSYPDSSSSSMPIDTSSLPVQDVSQYLPNNVDISQNQPIMRNIPPQKDTNMFIEMGKYRNEQFKRMGDGHLTKTPFETSKYAHIGLREGSPRMKPLKTPVDGMENIHRSSSSQSSHSSHSSNSSGSIPPDVREYDSLLWRNYSGYDSNPMMYERLPKMRDFRLEKKKERQDLYKKRQEENKMKNDAIIQEYLHNKKTWYEKDVLKGITSGDCNCKKVKFVP